MNIPIHPEKNLNIPRGFDSVSRIKKQPIITFTATGGYGVLDATRITHSSSKNIQISAIYGRTLQYE